MEKEKEILEELIEYLKRNDVQDIMCDTTPEIEAIENILKRIDFLERKVGIKINQEIDKMKIELYKDYIPKSKIKEKIEEYKKKIEERPYDKPIIEIYIRVLQKLMEEK